jgi:hypothetical protein
VVADVAGGRAQDQALFVGPTWWGRGATCRRTGSLGGGGSQAERTGTAATARGRSLTWTRVRSQPPPPILGFHWNSIDNRFAGALQRATNSTEKRALTTEVALRDSPRSLQG